MTSGNVSPVCSGLTLFQAAALSDCWGSTRHGHLFGLLKALPTVASALAPFAGTVLVIPLSWYSHMIDADPCFALRFDGIDLMRLTVVPEP